MIIFSVQMDEERILEDGFLYLDAVWKCIEATFAQRDVTLYAQENDVRYYSRNIDKHDFEYQWMVHSVFQDEDWFQYYVKSWRFYEIGLMMILFGYMRKMICGRRMIRNSSG